ncbi:MAG TPA: Holliday junction resolvase RuvX [Dehalococcoidales bacterium]|nr:Holliday junction resolvase RuvX [Dehalococcoidales bacterium]
MRTLGLDIGDRRIGVAVSDPLGMLARPLTVLERVEDSAAVEAIIKLVKEFQISKIIAGWPLLMNGTTGGQAEKVRQFIEKLQAVLDLPVEFRDERLTTATARDMLAAGSKKKAKFEKKGQYDAAAAAIILQSYLNESRPMVFPDNRDTP